MLWRPTTLYTRETAPFAGRLTLRNGRHSRLLHHGGLDLTKIGTFIALALATTTLAQVDPAKTIATVNGEAIKGAEYYRRMEYLDGVGKMYGQNFVSFPPGFLTLEQLITEKLVLQMAKEKGVLPTDAEVAADLKATVDNDPSIMVRWKESGRSEAELLVQTKYSLAQFRLMTRGITITDAEVDKFYADNPTLFQVEKQVELRIVVVNTAEAQQAVEADLKAGKSFADIAKARSIDVSKDWGGDFGTRPWDGLSEAAKEALKNVPAGGTSAWVTSGETRVKFFLGKVIAPSKKPLNDSLRKIIRREQLLAKGRVANNLQKDMIELRRRSSVVIAEKAFSDSYKKFVDSLIGAGGQ